jgi:hypothetical protein
VPGIMLDKYIPTVVADWAADHTDAHVTNLVRTAIHR